MESIYNIGDKVKILNDRFKEGIIVKYVNSCYYLLNPIEDNKVMYLQYLVHVNNLVKEVC